VFKTFLESIITEGVKKGMEENTPEWKQQMITEEGPR